MQKITEKLVIFIMTMGFWQLPLTFYDPNLYDSFVKAIISVIISIVISYVIMIKFIRENVLLGSIAALEGIQEAEAEKQKEKTKKKLIMPTGLDK